MARAELGVSLLKNVKGLETGSRVEIGIEFWSTEWSIGTASADLAPESILDGIAFLRRGYKPE
jgi:hypothetical protein